MNSNDPGKKYYFFLIQWKSYFFHGEILKPISNFSGGSISFLAIFREVLWLQKLSNQKMLIKWFPKPIIANNFY